MKTDKILIQGNTPLSPRSDSTETARSGRNGSGEAWPRPFPLPGLGAAVRGARSHSKGPERPKGSLGGERNHGPASRPRKRGAAGCRAKDGEGAGRGGRTWQLRSQRARGRQDALQTAATAWRGQHKGCSRQQPQSLGAGWMRESEPTANKQRQ